DRIIVVVPVAYAHGNLPVDLRPEQLGSHVPAEMAAGQQVDEYGPARPDHAVRLHQGPEAVRPGRVLQAGHGIDEIETVVRERGMDTIVMRETDSGMVHAVPAEPLASLLDHSRGNIQTHDTAGPVAVERRLHHITHAAADLHHLRLSGNARMRVGPVEDFQVTGRPRPELVERHTIMDPRLHRFERLAGSVPGTESHVYG